MPSTGSRYQFCLGVYDEEGRLFLTEREPYRYVDHPDNRIHTVVEGDTLFTLAGKYFAPLPRACGYWWVIADFQIDPIHDPTLKLRAGARLVIPSIRTLNDEVLSDSRRYSS
jgi:hypothetical protein